MKKSLKRIISLVLSLTIVISLFCGNAWATDQIETGKAKKQENVSPTTMNVVDSGTCGQNLTWVLDENGTLTISGTGAMHDYWEVRNDDSPPWVKYNLDVESLVVEKGVTTISAAAFTGCNALTNVSLPESLTSIGEGSFVDCGLKEISIPTSVHSIGSFAFAADQDLEKINVLPKNKQYASSDGVLYNKKKTSLMVFPAGKKTAKYMIPSSVTQIASFAFYECDNLKSVVIPSNVKTIPGCTFFGCPSLEEIYFKGSAPTFKEHAFFGITANVYYPAGDKTWSPKKLMQYDAEQYDAQFTWKKWNPYTIYITKLINASGKKMKVYWKKSSKVTGYQIEYSTNSKFSHAKIVTVKSNKSTSTKINKMTKKEKYYARVRTYKKVSGRGYYSSWSSAKSVTIKK